MIFLGIALSWIAIFGIAFEVGWSRGYDECRDLQSRLSQRTE